MSYRSGDIVLADLLDPLGQPCNNPHPAMVLRLDAQVAYLVAITTSFDDPPPGHWIRMRHSPGGHSQTGLHKPCVLKCDWVVRFQVPQIIRKIGEMPSDHFELATNQIISLVQQKKLAIVNQSPTES